MCRPQVNTWTQSYCQNIAWWPIYQIEIEIILECWCIKYLEGNLRNLSLLFIWCSEQLIFFKTCEWCNLIWIKWFKWLSFSCSSLIESKNIIRWGWSEWKWYRFFDAAYAIHELVIEITSLNKMRILYP